MIRDYERKKSVRAVQFTGGNIGEIYQLTRGHALPRSLTPGKWAVTDGNFVAYYSDEEFKKHFRLVEDELPYRSHA